MFNTLELQNNMLYTIMTTTGLVWVLNVLTKSGKVNCVYLDDEGSSTGCCCLSVGGSNICSRSSLDSSKSAN